MKFTKFIGVLVGSTTFVASLPVPESADADDNVVYRWSLPDAEKRETVDADDAVVYRWSLPDSEKREIADADDDVVYRWSLPDTE